MSTEVKNTVEFGLENLHFAEFEKEKNTYKAPEKVAGAVSLKIKSKVSEIKLHADNGVYFSLINNNGYDGDLEIYNFDDEFKIKYLGYKKDGNGILVEPAIILQKTFALLFKTIGDKQDRVTILYKVTLGKPDFEVKTIEDKVDVEVMKIPVNISPIEFEGYTNGKVIQSSTIDVKRKAKWFEKVYTPSTLATGEV